MLAGFPLVPLAGDWDSDGIDSVGLYDSQNGTFLFRNTNSPGFSDTEIEYGPVGPGILPVVGDWDGDGDDTPGIYDTGTATFYLANNTDSDAADEAFRFGAKNQNWLPMAGDWDGDGKDDVGLYDPEASQFFLRIGTQSGKLFAKFRYGPRNGGWLPVVGDWDRDGADTVGLYNPEIGRFFIQNVNSTGPTAERFGYTAAVVGLTPLAGDWDGDSTVTVGLFDATTGLFHLKESRMTGPADSTFYVVASLDPLPLDTGTADLGPNTFAAMAPDPLQLKKGEVRDLLEYASKLSDSEDAVIAIVDRNGIILGVRVEQDIINLYDADVERLVFAIDGAVAKARTAAFFANGNASTDLGAGQLGTGKGAPLTSRTIRFISQSTIIEREVASNPNDCDSPVTRTVCGPGFVAPIGLGGHFPPEIFHTPAVDLFAIEHTNRDSIVHPGPNLIRETSTLNPDGTITPGGDDIVLRGTFEPGRLKRGRFNIDPARVPMGQELAAPESYGFQSGRLTRAQSRGIATLPGGVPIYRDSPDDPDAIGDTLIGGIGVFLPGPDGFATYEQQFTPRIPDVNVPVGYRGQSEADRINAPRVLDAEAIAFGTSNAFTALPDVLLPQNTLTLVGVALETIGPNPNGLAKIVRRIDQFTPSLTASGFDLPVTTSDLTLDGSPVPQGWLVLPHDAPPPPPGRPDLASDITAADVSEIIVNAVNQANQTRAAIRLPRGRRTKMVFAVADKLGNVLGLFRMPDATVFSIDVAVAKARNTAYYANPAAIQDQDRVDGSVPPDGIPDLGRGVALTNRTFRFLSEPRYPSGVDGSYPPPFSILLDPGTGVLTAENTGAPAAASDFQTVLGYDAFHPATNFRFQQFVLSQNLGPSVTSLLIGNQNGIVFFPGSTPVYTRGDLAGGYGVSGDGVDQDDVVTAFGAQGYLPSNGVDRADQEFIRGVRLPYLKFLRNPEG